MRYTYAFFDLDGTLTDSARGITHSVQYALQKCGIEPPGERELLSFVGPPLIHSFRSQFGMTEEEALRAIAHYREYYRSRGMLECSVYDGIPTLLERLCARGITCVLATCKPHFFAERILAHFDLSRYFAFVSGPELDGTRGEKHEVIAHAMTHLDLCDPERILMIGDRRDDVAGAAKHGIDCAGILWGFGSREELAAAGAAHFCLTPQDVLTIFAD